MKLARVSSTLGLVALSVIASPFAVAADPGGYVGFNVGQSRAKIDDERIIRNLMGGGFPGLVSIVDDDRDTGYKLYGGYQFNKNFAVEGGYFDLGKFGFVATTAAPNAGTLSGNIRLKGVNLDLVGILPITEKFSALGRVGVNYAEAKDHFSGTGAVVVTNPNPTEKDTNYKLGLGLQYDFTPSVGMRAEWERYRINDAVGNKGDVDLVSLGLVFRFGAKTPAPAPAPQPAAVTPPPPPRAAPPPPPPKAVTPPPPPKAVTPPPPPPPAPMEKARPDRN